MEEGLEHHTMPNIMDICYSLFDSYGCVGHYGQGGANYGHIIFLAMAFATMPNIIDVCYNLWDSYGYVSHCDQGDHNYGHNIDEINHYEGSG